MPTEFLILANKNKPGVVTEQCIYINGTKKIEKEFCKNMDVDGKHFAFRCHPDCWETKIQ